MDARALEAPVATLVALPRTIAGCLRAQPALAALARSGRRVTALAAPETQPLVELLDGVGAVLERGETAATSETIIEAAFGEAVLLTEETETALTIWRAAVPWRWGYRSGLRRFLLRPAVPAPGRRARGPQRWQPLLRALSVSEPETWEPRLHLPRELLDTGAERLGRARMGNAESPRLGLALDADASGTRWKFSRAAELARALRRCLPAASMAVLTDSEHLWPAVRVHETTGHIHPVIGPDLDQAGLAAVVAQLDCVIGPAGPATALATALGRPTVRLVERTSHLACGGSSAHLTTIVAKRPRVDEMTSAVELLLEASAGEESGPAR